MMTSDSQQSATSPVIRPVRPEDEANWLFLRHSLWPREPMGNLQQEMQSILADSQGQAVFVAESPSGQLVAFIEVSIHPSVKWCSTPNVGYIEGWFVRPEWRGKGLGNRLAQAAEDWAREKGCREMASDTRKEYVDSPAAHQRAGYEQVAGEPLHFRKNL